MITEARLAWIQIHRNATAQISRELGVTADLVRKVLYGERQSVTGQIERRLADLKCPGFEKFKQQEAGK